MHPVRTLGLPALDLNGFSPEGDGAATDGPKGGLVAMSDMGVARSQTRISFAVLTR
jgi:hypothetical protein